MRVEHTVTSAQLDELEPFRGREAAASLSLLTMLPTGRGFVTAKSVASESFLTSIPLRCPNLSVADFRSVKTRKKDQSGSTGWACAVLDEVFLLTKNNESAGIKK